MSFFDALLHAFGTAGTGGFGLSGMADFSITDSAYIDVILSVGIFFSESNFNLYYLF